MSLSQPLPENLPLPTPATLDTLRDLIGVVAQLRSPEGGCPWDLQQTPQSLMPHIIEEAYELVDAIQRGQPEEFVEELGDLLLQVLLQAQIGQDQGTYTLEQVAAGIRDKLIRRHPHVFGSVAVADVAAVQTNWDRIKAQEKGQTDQSFLAPRLQEDQRILPPLLAAMKISKKAAKVGFEFDDLDQVWDKVHEEVEELKAALRTDDRPHQESELGDIFFALVQIARWSQLDPEAALRGTNDRFIQRFSLVEQLAGKPLDRLTLAELDALWKQAKKHLAQAES